jgi:peptide chain release factor 1
MPISTGCIMEIRPAAGGEEAKNWVKDILRMYLRYATTKGWKVMQIDDANLRITGNEAFSDLQHESGVHRVQRIPATERHGRIHTSTATVAVLPILTNQEIQINHNDLEWQFYHASSHGGQNVQKVSTAVRVTHKPSGITAKSERERFQEQNRRHALEMLRVRLWQQQELNKEQTIAGYRSAIGRGMRAEKIRTYNYPQNRVTDHRIGKKFRVEDIVNGRLEKLISALQSSGQNS